MKTTGPGSLRQQVTRLVPLLLGGLFLPAMAAQTPAATEAEQIREELRLLRRDYEQRLQLLEERLRRLEQTPAPPAAPPPGAPPRQPAVAERPAQDPEPAAASVSTNNLVSPDARDYLARQFQRDTESRERAVLMDSQPLRERVEQVLQDFIDIRGYFRAGYGRNNEGGPQVAFQAPGAFSKYRLGNEAENYGELTFGKNFYVADLFKPGGPAAGEDVPTGPVARVQTTVSIFNPYQDLLSSADTDFGLPEVWASIGNVVGTLPDLKFWAGSRYYRRHDIHISDFYFYNMSGTGGGFEDLKTPVGRLALAWIGAGATSGFSDLPEPDPANEAGFSKASWDLRLYDVPLPLGRGEFGVAYARTDSGRDADGNSAPDSEGVALTFLHTRTGLFSEDGVNKFSLQYGTGAAKTFTSGFETFTRSGGVFIRPDDPDSWRFRVTEHFTANLGDHFSLGPALVYQLTDYQDGSGRLHWASAGLRPILHFDRHLSLAFEGGVDWVHDEGTGSKDTLYKLTVAPQVSLGGRFMSRPVIRAFVTYAGWGDDFVGQVGGNDYATGNSGLTYGVQMEAWW